MESVLGKKKFVAVYALAGIAGNILSCVVNPRTPVREGEWEKQSGERSARRAVISRSLSCVSLALRFYSEVGGNVVHELETAVRSVVKGHWRAAEISSMPSRSITLYGL